jgi:(E)-4-hydroxy-3-methylbut-2-enyl-diphosphate synthase
VASPLELTGLATGKGRRRSRRINVGRVPVGDGAPVSVQSMTITKTADVNATLQQIAELATSGCDIVRVAVPDTDDAAALPAIAQKSTIPVVADIHFQWKYAMAAIEAGCAGVRINPGNIKKHDKVKLIAQEAQARGIPIRVGVNAGSLQKEILAKHGGPTPEALVESALFEVGILESVGFGDIKISVKHQNPVMMIQAYRLLAVSCDYPLHLGVTEAGTPRDGIIKSTVGIGTLLAEGIGDTIRVSLTAHPVEEVKVGNQILGALGLRPKKLDLVACPSCGRAEVDVFRLANAVEERMGEIEAPLRVAVMGCIVNGPGEAREADIGVASGKGKGQIFRRGQVIRTVPESEIVDALMQEAKLLAEEHKASSAAAEGKPEVIRG